MIFVNSFSSSPAYITKLHVGKSVFVQIYLLSNIIKIFVAVIGSLLIPNHDSNDRDNDNDNDDDDDDDDHDEDDDDSDDNNDDAVCKQAPKWGIGRKEKSASWANGVRYGGKKERKGACGHSLNATVL